MASETTERIVIAKGDGYEQFIIPDNYVPTPEEEREIERFLAQLDAENEFWVKDFRAKMSS